MRFLKPLLFILLAGSFAGCSKASDTGKDTVSTTSITATGTLQKQGFTTYQYGTHVLIASPTLTYVLKSSTINLDPYVGMHVMITAVNTHYTAENGPELYDVTYIVQQ